ncbi:protein FAR1-RELATED SEQUENCE 5-like [Arachis ipaensis]|uniref:protein FAR1-RELATED SEQUENCE 5-like n=1 Tax=Arachis ipaensis TaxID=130454 RepID=UPI0007AEF101|nr:protein FAR1-RELATED SEQUENCE 5-like [Arachis ipaensis]
MDSNFQFTGVEDDSDWLSEEEYFRVSCSSGDDENDSFGNGSETVEMGDDAHENGVGSDPETCQGDAPSFRSTENFVDKVFSTEEEAYAAYKQFARLRGFGVRKGDAAQINGVLVWKVQRIDNNHNHPLATTMFSHLLPSHQNLSESDKAKVDSLKKFGIATSKIMTYMARQSGGYGMLRFTKRDLYNYVDSQRIAQINDRDAAATISYLEGKANADMMTVARYTKTVEDRLGSLFWVDRQMMEDYQLFGDVVAFDATYRSNKYKKPLVVFSGSNHHKQMAIFGFALLEDEDVRTYRWVLLNILDVMDNKKPSIVVTDGDKAMRAAITNVLPLARKVFKKAVYANFDIAEFEEYWRTAVENLGLMNNSWVKSTYELRHSWATAYLRGTFCASYRTTYRCEGINAFVKGFLKSTNSLLELVHSLDRVVKDYCNNEVTAQCYSSYYTPVLTTGLDNRAVSFEYIHQGSLQGG